MNTSADLVKEWVDAWPDATRASRDSHTLQIVGRKILDTGRLVEVEPGVFSTAFSSAPLLLDRLRAGAGVPLVEVETFLPDDTPETFPAILGPQTPLVKQVLWSDGTERNTTSWGNHFEVEYADLVLARRGFNCVTSALSHETFHDYDESTPDARAYLGGPRRTGSAMYEGPRGFDTLFDAMLERAQMVVGL